MIADDILQHVPEFRDQARSLMIDTASVTRSGSEPVFDPDTGDLTPAASTTVYSGPCRLRQPTSGESEILFGDEQLTRTRFIACLPHDAAGLQVDDVITITASGDPDVLTRRYVVTHIPLATFTLYKGYACEADE